MKSAKNRDFSHDAAQTLARATEFHARGALAEAARLYRHILRKKANHPDALHRLGIVELQTGAIADALVHLRRAAQLRPGDGAILTDYGVALAASGRAADAEATLARAVERAPDHAPAWCNLADMRAERGDDATAVAAYRRAIALMPRYPQAHANLAASLVMLGAWDEALAACRTALSQNPDLGAAPFNEATMLLRLGRFAEGWPRFEARWRLPHLAAVDRTWPEPRWDGGPLDGRTLLVHDEQGLGDAIQFARFVPALAPLGATIVLACRAPLVRLLGTLPGVATVLAREAPREPAQLRVPIMSLPYHLGTTLETIPARVPYLAVPAGIAAPSAIAAATGIRVGIVWAGNPAHDRDRERSIPLPALAPLGAVPGISWFALQLGADADAIAHVLPGAVDLGAGFTDLADTAAAVAALDLVITVDTAVAHLAGALGKPVWILITAVPDWRWLLEREDSPWYPTARLYRQPARGDWSSVLARVAADLAAGATAHGHQA